MIYFLPLYCTACKPLDLPNGKVLGNSRIVGATRDIACNGGFMEMNGILQVYCTSSGTWDKSPSCQRDKNELNY